jgi:hypothetical protein
MRYENVTPNRYDVFNDQDESVCWIDVVIV